MVKPIWEFFPNFSGFFYDGSPKCLKSKINSIDSKHILAANLPELTIRFSPRLALVLTAWLLVSVDDIQGGAEVHVWSMEGIPALLDYGGHLLGELHV